MSYRSQFVAELSVSLVSLGIPLSPVANSVAGAGDWNSRHSGGGQGGVWVVRLACCWCKASLKEESSIVQSFCAGLLCTQVVSHSFPGVVEHS